MPRDDTEGWMRDMTLGRARIRRSHMDCGGGEELKVTFHSVFPPSRLTLAFSRELSWKGRIQGGCREVAGSLRGPAGPVGRDLTGKEGTAHCK